MSAALVQENVWLDKNMYSDAERAYYESLSKEGASLVMSAHSSLANEVAKAREHIKKSLECMDSVATLTGVPNTELTSKLQSVEKQNGEMKKAIDDLRNLVISLQARVASLESSNSSAIKVEPPKNQVQQKPAADDEDDGVDLFGSDDEEESAEAAKLREQRLEAYNAKKAKMDPMFFKSPLKSHGVAAVLYEFDRDSMRLEDFLHNFAFEYLEPVLIAKSNIILDVKPWDDETDMPTMEKLVREINTDGLLWGAAKFVPLAYGIKKLQISCVVEDDKVSIDWLTEEIEKLEDHVQSVDIAAFNKV